MADIKIYDIEGNTKSKFKLDKELLVEIPHQQAIFDCVIAEDAGMRQGTHSTLTKGEVRGGGKKPWKQKHTGRARTGSTRNPHWTGGGVVFGPKPNRNYLKKVNSKVRKLAFKSALTLKANDNFILALENNAKLEKPSVKKIINFLEKAKIDNNKKVLFILNDNGNNNIKLSTNNLKNITTKKWDQVSVKDVLHNNFLVIQQESFNNFKEILI